MNLTARVTSRVRVLIGFALLSAVGTIQAFSQQHNEQWPVHVEINFSQQYQFEACAPSVPVSDSCLAVNLSADVPHLGSVTVARVAFFNGSLFDSSHPTCLPIETTGKVTLRDGTLDIHGIGNVCFVDGTGSYNLIVTGGTGVYEGVIGGGQITVPPPLSGSTGRELWSFNLYLKR